MIRRIRRTLPWFATLAALLLLALPAQADDIEPEPYVEEEVEVEPEPEPEPEYEEEEEPEVAEESDRNIEKAFDFMLVRPLYLSRLIVGLPFFIFYPFTIGSGWDEDVVALLWTEPYEATFKRPLGEAPGDY
ncbi:MAG: hypothetical protein JRD03_07695 [Deltaproteobacteria bacterium]|nr:hypothetical protein [Deltaproteobacteria bacterium]